MLAKMNEQQAQDVAALCEIGVGISNDGRPLPKLALTL